MENEKNENFEKLSFIFLNLLFAISMSFCIAMFYFYIINWTPLLEVDYSNLEFSFQKSVLFINDLQFGLPFYGNIIFIISLWLVLIYNVLKELKKPMHTIFPLVKNKFLIKVTNLFF